MDFDTEAADDFYRAVKSWEDGLPCYLTRAGADSDDCESDNGLLTPPPDFDGDMEKAWIVPPPRPTYSDSWIRIMKKRAEEGCTSPIENGFDTSSISSFSDLDALQRESIDYPIDAQGYHCPASDDSDGLAFSGESSGHGYVEGSTATTADAEDLFAEMLDAYTVPKDLKIAIACASSLRKRRSTSSLSKDKPAGISKRSSPRSSPRLRPRTRSSRSSKT